MDQISERKVFMNFVITLSFDKSQDIKPSMSRAEIIAVIEKEASSKFEQLTDHLHGMKVEFAKYVVGSIFVSGTKEQACLVAKYMSENNLGTISCTDEMNLKLIQ